MESDTAGTLAVYGAINLTLWTRRGPYNAGLIVPLIAAPLMNTQYRAFEDRQEFDPDIQTTNELAAVPILYTRCIFRERDVRMHRNLTPSKVTI